MITARAVGMSPQHFTRSLEWTDIVYTPAKRDEEVHDERTKGAPKAPCSGNTEWRERQTRRYLMGLYAARRVRRGARHLRADLANYHIHNPDTHHRSLLHCGWSDRISGGAK